MNVRIDDLVRDLAPRLADLAETLTGTVPTSRTARELRFGNRGSLSIKLTGLNAPCWHDHEAGVGGDALGLVAHLRRCSMREAAAWARTWLGTDRFCPLPAPRPTLKPVEQAESSTADIGRRLWQEAVNPAGTPVVKYLASRSLALPIDAQLRFHPRTWRNAAYGPHGPAMLALMTHPVSAEPVGLHVTYLRPDGAGKAEGHRKKIMLGHAGVVRLVPDEDVTIGLGLAEGIETALAVMQSFGWTPVWAAASAGSIARFPVLLGIEALTIFADADDCGAGMDAARTCAERWNATGCEVTIAAAPTGHDFADALRGAA
jgi:hypothetical protein